jgi:hypothetical protein
VTEFGCAVFAAAASGSKHRTLLARCFVHVCILAVRMRISLEAQCARQQFKPCVALARVCGVLAPGKGCQASKAHCDANRNRKKRARAQ